GAEAAERHLWQLLRRHHLTPLLSALNTADVMRVLPALDGSAFTAAAGYEGGGAGQGVGLLSLGTYGGLGPAAPAKLPGVEAMADLLAERGLLKTTEVILYGHDEDCRSPDGAGWRALLASSKNPSAKQVHVSWTCSEDPAHQPVEIAMMFAAAFAPNPSANV